MNKKAIAILGGIFILIVAALGVLIYQRSKKDPEPETPVVETPIEETPVEETPVEPEASGMAVRLTDDAVISPSLFFQGNGISYFDSEGHLYQTELSINDGVALLSNKIERSIDLKPNMTKIVWPIAGNGFIAEFNSNTKPNWSYFDTNKGAYFNIPSQVYSLDWMPAGDKIIYNWVGNDGKASLQFANPDTSGYQVITDLFAPDNIVRVSPDGKKVLLYRAQTIDVTKNVINMVGTDGQNFTTVVKDGYNTGVKWSPDSTKFIFNKRDASSQKLNLWLADVTTGTLKDLGVATSVAKTVWSKNSKIIYTGVPKTGIPGQSLTQDDMYKVTVETGEKQQFEPGVPVDMQDLFLSFDESVLFFRNAQDNSLYYISLN